MGGEHLFNRFSQQALQTLHRYRAVMFSPPHTLRHLEGRTEYPSLQRKKLNTPTCKGKLNTPARKGRS